MARSRELSSSHSRGWPRSGPLAYLRKGVVPALAGVVPPRLASPTSRRSRPRARGGGPWRCSCWPGQGPSSPRSRGGPCSVPCTVSRARSSPRSRGWSGSVADGCRHAGVVPALAGVVPRVAPHDLRAGVVRALAGVAPMRFWLPSVVRSAPRSREWFLVEAEQHGWRAADPERLVARRSKDHPSRTPRADEMRYCRR